MSNRILGSGNHRYAWTAWGKVAEGVQLGYTHGVCEDAQGRIFVHNMSEHAVVIFDADGNFLDAWGKEFAQGAHGLQYSLEDDGEFLYLADIARHIVVKTTLSGEMLWTLGCPMESGVYGVPEEFVPTNVAIAPNGSIYVADGYGKSYIHQYTADAEYVRTWGGEGDAPGKMRCPHGIWVDTRGETPLVVVADRANVRLQCFTLDGEHTGFVTDDLLHPCHFDQRESELLVPDLHGRVTILDRDNRLVTHLGENPGVQDKEGYPNLPHDQREPGKFISPHGAIWDRQGNIYVVEWVSDGRITKLVRQS